MKYKYFVVYQLMLETALVRIFNQEEILDHPIESIEDIRALEDKIKSNYSLVGECIIISYKLF